MIHEEAIKLYLLLAKIVWLYMASLMYLIHYSVKILLRLGIPTGGIDKNN